MKLGADSARLPAARRFGIELHKALAAQCVSTRGLAADMGISRSRIGNWSAGTSLPSVELAERLADRLMWPALADIARRGRERVCDACSRTFVVETASPQRYCSVDCRRFQNAKRVPGRRDLTRAVLERRTVRYQTAIAAMCAACEPSGVCRTCDCPLQLAGVSPLSIASRGAA